MHAGTLRSQFGETSEALFLTQGYVYDSAASAERRFKNEEPGYQYSRFSNPTVSMFEAAHVRARRRAGGARDRDRHGGGHHRADGPGARRRPHRRRRRRCSAPAATWSRITCRATASPRRWSTAPTSTQWRNAVRPNTKTFFLESPTNPTLEVIDIAAIAEIAHAAGATLVVDNVFSTPLFQKPLALGADCVVYSATKHIDGQGRCLGGVILGSEKFIQDNVHNLIRQTGPSLSPFNAWVLLKGLETLSVRVQRQTETAATVAVALAEHPKISRLIYPRPARPSAGRDRPPADAAAARRWSPSRSRAARTAAFRFQDALDAHPHQQQSGRRQEPDHPSGDHHAPAAHARRSAPSSASATGWCGSHAGSSIPTT